MNIIRKTRENLKLTQAELGSYLGVSSNTVARWERNVTNPENSKMLELALLGLETKMNGIKTREKIRKLETNVRKIQNRINKKLVEMGV